MVDLAGRSPRRQALMPISAAFTIAGSSPGAHHFPARMGDPNNSSQ
jgi:hypothetical protein